LKTRNTLLGAREFSWILKLPNGIIHLTKGNGLGNISNHGRYPFTFFGLRGAADAEGCSIWRKSRFIPASSFRVGILSKGDLGFFSL
jgi:hypothetical protein